MKRIYTLFIVAMLAANHLFAQDVPEPAGKVLKDACKQAAAEKKNVMIIFHASWCGWCKKFDASINDPSCRDFFEKNYVIKHLDVLERQDKKNLENPGAVEMYEQNGGKGGGIPFFLIYDKNGKLLADSKMPVANPGSEGKRSNIGCPSADEELTAFVQILRNTSKINDKQAAAIKTRFAQNRN